MPRILKCPCGSPVYPEEVRCSNCDRMVRCYCIHCHALININNKFCTKCGQINEKYNPGLQLEDMNGNKLKPVDEPSDLESLGIRTQAATKPNLLEEILEKEFDDESNVLAREIAQLKTELQTYAVSRDDKAPKNILLENLTTDYSGYKLGNRDVNERSMDVMREPAVDEAHLLIQSIPISSAELDEGEAVVLKEENLLDFWDCEIVVHSENRREPVHVGLGSNPAIARGIPGTICFTEASLIFFSYLESFEDVEHIFTYVDMNLKYLIDSQFMEDIHDNKLVFANHGIFKKRFPDTREIVVNFSWSIDPGKGEMKNQSFMLQSLLNRLKMYPQEAVIFAGKFFFSTNKATDDPVIVNILEDLKINVPKFHDVLKTRYTKLF